MSRTIAAEQEALCWRAEDAAINGFPALRRALLDGWLLRFSGGTRRTPNSATPLRNGPWDVDALVAGAEALYRRQGQRAIFRIPSFIDPAIDERLAALGYSAEGASRVIYGDIDDIVSAPVPAAGPEVGTRLLPCATPAWFASLARLQQQTQEQADVYHQIVESIVLPVAFAEITVAGETAAAAYGVIHHGLLCYESVVTEARHRRRGHARRGLAALAQWARKNGAICAGLQVEAPNAPARALYHDIGLTTELHRYHYRRQPAPP